MPKDEALKAWTQRFTLVTLALMSFMVIGYLAFISFYPIPPENTRIVDTTQGFLMGTVLNAVISIFTQFLIPKKDLEQDEKQQQGNG